MVATNYYILFLILVHNLCFYLKMQKYEYVY